MSDLENPGWEAFAQGRARGRNILDLKRLKEIGFRVAGIGK